MHLLNCSSGSGKWEGKLPFICIFNYFDIIKLIFNSYFRNFEESEDELRNEVIESLEKLATSKEEENREESPGFSKGAGKLGGEEISIQKYAAFSEGLENISTRSNDKVCIADENQETSTTHQNVQVWLLYFFLSDKLVSIRYSVWAQVINIHSVRVFQSSQGFINFSPNLDSKANLSIEINIFTLKFLPRNLSDSRCDRQRNESLFLPPRSTPSDVNILLHGKGELRLQVEVRLLLSWPSNRGGCFWLPRWAQCNQRVFNSGRRQKREPERCHGERGWAWCCRLWRWRNMPYAKEYRQLLESGKGQAMDFPQKPTEGTQSCWHLDFGFWKSTLDFWPTEL